MDEIGSGFCEDLHPSSQVGGLFVLRREHIGVDPNGGNGGLGRQGACVLESIHSDESGPWHAPTGSSESLELAFELVRIIRKLTNGVRAERSRTCCAVRRLVRVVAGNLNLALHRCHSHPDVGTNASGVPDRDGKMAVSEAICREIKG